MRRVLAGMVVVLALAGMVVYTLGLRDEPAREQTAPIEGLQEVAAARSELSESASDYVGSHACAECHAEIAAMYAEHPMAKTLATVGEASQIEHTDGDACEFETQGCSYRAQRVGERMIHTEFLAAESGQPVYEQAVDVQYAVGSGSTARSYLIDRGGLLFESPLTWYVEQQKWDLSPGYEDNPRQRFNRRVSDGCVQCHSGRAAPEGDRNSNRFENPPFVELGIGCERCHGPGRRHVEKFSGDGAGDDSDADLYIVNPAKLDEHLAESVCYQCHMDGKRRILRKERSYHDFRPGMATEDVWTVFAARTQLAAEGSVPFTSHVEQMHASACFRGSDGKLRCTSCHDPHRSPGPDERASFYRERCNVCHSEQGCSVALEVRERPPANNSCIHCHMPTAGASDIPHATQSDHRVLRFPAADKGTVSPSDRKEKWFIFDESEHRLPEWELQRARALALCDQAVEDVDRTLAEQATAALEAVAARDADDVEVWRSLGFLYGLANEPTKSQRAFEAALRADPRDELSLKNLGLTAYRTRSFDLARRCYESYLKLNPWDPTVYGPYAAILAAYGDLPAALEAAERGLEIDPTDRELRRITAQLYARSGDGRMSQHHQDKLRIISERLDPWDQQRKERLQQRMREKLTDDAP